MFAPTECDLLRMLLLNAGRMVTYETLLDQVWSERRRANACVVRAFVKQLRAKLGGDAAAPLLDLHCARRRLPHVPVGRTAGVLTALCPWT